MFVNEFDVIEILLGVFLILAIIAIIPYSVKSVRAFWPSIKTILIYCLAVVFWIVLGILVYYLGVYLKRQALDVYQYVRDYIEYQEGSLNLKSLPNLRKYSFYTYAKMQNCDDVSKFLSTYKLEKEISIEVGQEIADTYKNDLCESRMAYFLCSRLASRCDKKYSTSRIFIESGFKDKFGKNEYAGFLQENPVVLDVLGDRKKELVVELNSGGSGEFADFLIFDDTFHFVGGFSGIKDLKIGFKANRIIALDYNKYDKTEPYSFKIYKQHNDDISLVNEVKMLRDQFHD